MEDIFVAVMMMVVIFSLIPLYFWRRRLDSRRRDQHEEEPQALAHTIDRYRLELGISDETAHTVIVLFDEPATEL
ncbi:hypothetical protein OROHE_025401 [Orobanche hederae]